LFAFVALTIATISRQSNEQSVFRNACKNRFEAEVEIHHRLRCIYAWAEKGHQDNKVGSVLVDEGWLEFQKAVRRAFP
jgi:uncharacterized protein involved in tolerance to divalent cations